MGRGEGGGRSWRPNASFWGRRKRGDTIEEIRRMCSGGTWSYASGTIQVSNGAPLSAGSRVFLV